VWNDWRSSTDDSHHLLLMYDGFRVFESTFSTLAIVDLRSVCTTIPVIAQLRTAVRHQLTMLKGQTFKHAV
jgi:hypothetical protein